MKPERINYPDSSSAEIGEDGSYDLCLPSGRHVRGKADNPAAARMMVEVEHNNYVLDVCWPHGVFVPIGGKGPHFLVPLLP